MQTGRGKWEINMQSILPKSSNVPDLRSQSETLGAQAIVAKYFPLSTFEAHLLHLAPTVLMDFLCAETKRLATDAMFNSLY